MHTFSWSPTTQDASELDTNGAHLLGADGVAVRGEIHPRDGVITCESRSAEALALSLLWSTSDGSRIQLETTRLPARDEPYQLHLELARRQMMRVSVKREEWGLFDYGGTRELDAKIDRAQEALVLALESQADGEQGARQADAALVAGLATGDALCRFHADIFIKRRIQSGGFKKPFLGACVSPAQAEDAFNSPLRNAFDAIGLPLRWSDTQPSERDWDFDTMDAVVKRCQAQDLRVGVGPLLSFGVRSVPDWMHRYENDFDAILNYARQHIQQCVTRYRKSVDTWVVASGLHAENVFAFNFEQVMELTRNSVSLVRQLAPRARVVLELVTPWGEYYARNAQTIPPWLYAEMAAQSGVPFDAFAVRLEFGADADGYRFRDLLQVSSLIDRLASLGKPIQLTSVSVPSAPIGGGQWRKPWDEQRQGKWLDGLMRVSLSRPYVDCASIQLLDDEDAAVSTAGVLAKGGEPRAAFGALANLRSEFSGAGG